MIKPVKYVRKPLFVDAVQVTVANFAEVAEWCQGEVHESGYIRVRVVNPKTPRQSRAYVGDWILYTDRGYKVYLTKAFENAFDLVGEYQNNPDQFSMDEIESARENDHMVSPDATPFRMPEGSTTGGQIESLEQ